MFLELYDSIKLKKKKHKNINFKIYSNSEIGCLLLLYDMKFEFL